MDIENHIFSALNNPVRPRILEYLAGDEQQYVKVLRTMAREFDRSEAAIAQHMKSLLFANLIKVRKDSPYAYYRINSDAVDEVSDWIGKLGK